MALAKLAQTYALAGETEQARSILEKLQSLSRERYVSPYDLAMIYIALQDCEQALTSLEEALAQRSLWMGYIDLEPQLDPLRSDPRFQVLLRRVGLHEQAR